MNILSKDDANQLEEAKNQHSILQELQSPPRFLAEVKKIAIF